MSRSAIAPVTATQRSAITVSVITQHLGDFLLFTQRVLQREGLQPG